MNTMNILFTIMIVSLIYLVILMVNYFSKKKIESIEVRLYGEIIVTTFISVLFEILSVIFVSKHEQYPFIAYAVNKIFIVTILTYVYLLSLYAWSVFYKDDNRKVLVRNILKKGYAIVYFLFTIGILLLPVEFYYDGSKVYSYGTSTVFCYIGVSILIASWFICLFLNIKTALKKKLLPLFIFAFMSGIILFLRRFAPELTLVSSTEALIVFLMYFTIENPDVKMIQQLEIARDQADKANHAKTDFLSSMSHEIRTPLNAIVGFSDCIMDAENLGEAKENAKDIVNASQTLLEIVNGILDISKIEAGKIEIVSSKYNAPETFEELAKLITPRMNEKGLDFSYTIAPDLPMTLLPDILPPFTEHTPPGSILIPAPPVIHTLPVILPPFTTQVPPDLTRTAPPPSESLELFLLFFKTAPPPIVSCPASTWTRHPYSFPFSTAASPLPFIVMFLRVRDPLATRKRFPPNALSLAMALFISPGPVSTLLPQTFRVFLIVMLSISSITLFSFFLSSSFKESRSYTLTCAAIDGGDCAMNATKTRSDKHTYTIFLLIMIPPLLVSV